MQRVEQRVEEKKREGTKCRKNGNQMRYYYYFYHVLYVSSKDMRRHAIFHAKTLPACIYLQVSNVFTGHYLNSFKRERLDWRLKKHEQDRQDRTLPCQ